MRIAVAGGTGTVGRHVVQLAEAAGHDVRVLARSRGVDVRTGAGLNLDGVDVVIDVTSVGTQSARVSRAFFEAAADSLEAAETRAGVRHHIALSIIGVDRAPVGYYAGKAAQEARVERSAVPWSILRAAQFHEFAGQVSTQARLGRLVLVPVMRSQPLAARDVAERLLAIAEAGPSGRVPDLAGPREESMPELVRQQLRADGDPGRVLALPLPGGFMRALRDGTLLPGAEAGLTTQTFAEWLAAR